MLARDLALCYTQSHPILELVAETVRTAQLIKGCTRPDARRQRLKEQPTIHENVHIRLGCADLYRVEKVVPLARHLGEDRIQVRSAISTQQLARLLPIFRLAKEKHDFLACAGAQCNRGLQGRAWIETCSHPSRKRVALLQRGRMLKRPVAAKKFCPVACHRNLGTVEVSKCDAPAKFSGPRAHHEDCSRFRIELRDEVWRRSTA